MTPICQKITRIVAAVALAVLAAPAQAHADNVGSPGDSWNLPVFAVLLALTIAAIIAIVLFPEVFLPEFLLAVEEGGAEAAIAEGAEGAIAEEEAAAAARLQSFVDNVNPLFGEDNCAWCAREVDEALGDMFAGRTPQPYAPPWSQPGMAPPGASLTTGQSLAEEFGATFQESPLTEIAEQVQQAGNGARGLVATPGNPGHVFNVVNYGGRVFFIDGQTATVWPGLPNVPAGVPTLFLPTAGF